MMPHDVSNQKPLTVPSMPMYLSAAKPIKPRHRVFRFAPKSKRPRFPEGVQRSNVGAMV